MALGKAKQSPYAVRCSAIACAKGGGIYQGDWAVPAGPNPGLSDDWSIAYHLGCVPRSASPPPTRPPGTGISVGTGTDTTPSAPSPTNGGPPANSGTSDPWVQVAAWVPVSRVSTLLKAIQEARSP